MVRSCRGRCLRELAAIFPLKRPRVTSKPLVKSHKGTGDCDPPRKAALIEDPRPLRPFTATTPRSYTPLNVLPVNKLLKNLLICVIFVEIAPMSPILKKFNAAAVAYLVGGAGLNSCGRQDTGFMSGPAKPLPIVRLAEDPIIGAKVKQVPGSYIVMFRESNVKSNLFFSSFADEYSHHYSGLSDQYMADPRITSIDILSSVDLSGVEASDWTPEFSAPKVLKGLSAGLGDETAAGVMARVDFDSMDAAAEVLGEWEKGGRIWFAEPNERSELFAGELTKYGTDYASLQNWHALIKLPEAFNSLGGGKLVGAASEADILANSPVIAVLDSGVDYEHPLLAPNIWENVAGSIGAAGCSGDLHGCNTTAPSKGSLGNGEVWPVLASGPGKNCDPDPTNSCHHGTHVAGIIAAKPDASNKLGGVCPICKIMILRVVDAETGTISDDSQIRAFKYLAKFRKSGGSAVRIANASLGKYSRSRSLAILVDVLRHVGSGTLVIGAASNEDSMIRAYPGALGGAIAVAAVGNGTKDYVGKASFSNFGSWVDIAAPGYDIDSTLDGNTHGKKNGTSMATPIVAGAAGLLLAAYPSLSFDELRNKILNNANATLLYGEDTEGGKVNTQYYYPKVSGESARQPLLGGGLLDVNAMLTGKGTTATGQPLDRVSAGCGTIGSVGPAEFKSSSAQGWSVLWMLALPLLASYWRRRSL
jgi:subtilisin family serine protease